MSSKKTETETQAEALTNAELDQEALDVTPLVEEKIEDLIDHIDEMGGLSGDDKAPNNKTRKCGYIALVGPTNGGKSTLLNMLTGHKVSIVSRKVQTTRTRITAIAEHETEDTHSQIVFLDTPGLFKPRKKLDRAMIHAAESSMQEADTMALLIDASKPEHIVLKDVQVSLTSLARNAEGKNIALILNKIDKISHKTLLSITQKIAELHDDKLDAVFMISARKGSGTDAFMDYCAGKIEEGPWMFVGDEITTMPFRLMAAEITREVIMDIIHQEIPYALTVFTESVEHFDNGDFKLMQTILVEKNSQKTVLVGRAGSMIKQIGQRARLEMGHVFDGKIHLNLLVKVKPNWQDDPSYYALWNLQ